MSRIPVALQMYTLRDAAAKDFPGTLREAARIGYEGIELAGTGGMTARDLKELLGDLGLRIAGSHVGLADLEGNLMAALDYNAELGNPYIVCPWLPEDRRGSASAYASLGALFNRVGEACQTRGMTFCYHNHAFEFDVFDGKPGLDILFESSDPKLVQAELDTYWVQFGGHDPVAYLRKLSGRAPLVHLKDMTGDASRTFAELGQGVMDWDAILPACAEAGAKWLIVEQDSCQRPPLESVRISFDYLRVRRT